MFDGICRQVSVRRFLAGLQLAAFFLREPLVDDSLLLLGELEVLVVHGEVVDERGDREAQHEHAEHGRARPHQVAKRPRRVHVAVADRRHGDDGPPERVRNAGERFLVVHVVHERRTQQHADQQEHQHHEQLLPAGFQRVEENPQPGDVANQTENPEGSHQSQQRHEVDERTGLHRGGVDRLGDQFHVVGQDRQEIDDGERRSEEAQQSGRTKHSEEVLGAEERQAHDVDHHERPVRRRRRRVAGHRHLIKPRPVDSVGRVLVAQHGAVHYNILRNGHAEKRVCRRAERKDGHHDEHKGNPPVYLKQRKYFVSL